MFSSVVGTPLYMSPQILKREQYTTKCDIWSVGLIYYEMLFGKTPWPAKSQYELVNKIMEGKLKFPYNCNISQESHDFLKGCLEIEESARFSWEDIFKHKLICDEENLKNMFSKKKSIEVEHRQEMDQKAISIILELQSTIIQHNINIQKLFKGLDKSGDDRLDVNEFSKLVKIINSDVGPSDILHVFKMFDYNNDGNITFEEFNKLIFETDYSVTGPRQDPFLEEKAQKVLAQLKAVIKKHNLKLDQLFKSFDRNKNATLTIEEFEKMLEIIDPNITAKESEYLFKKVDIDGSGTITFEEFENSLKDKRKSIYESTLDSKAQKAIGELRNIIIKSKLDIQKIFKNFDKKLQNSLSLKEFTSMIKIIDSKLIDSEIEHIFKIFDEDNNGAIDFQEFSSHLLGKF
jgi:Ca2+-binding EF-hand superfamily protein